MSIDALTAIENFASGIFSAGMEFLFTWGELLGIIGLIGHLMRARAEGRHSMGPGKFIAGIVICGMLVALPSFINAGGTQMGFRADSFGPIAYVQPTTFGAAAGAANAMLSLVKLAGVGFAMNGISIWRKSLLDGHTALSSSESISKGNVKFVAGVLL
ncbi:conjugal transfer protein TraQ, partial [Escherichia coli]|nr:conjugal transfer protein TraQ [Escherichia coli]